MVLTMTTQTFNRYSFARTYGINARSNKQYIKGFLIATDMMRRPKEHGFRNRNEVIEFLEWDCDADAIDTKGDHSPYSCGVLDAVLEVYEC